MGRAGDAYHAPLLEAGCEYVEFSPAAEYRAAVAVVEGNMAAMRGEGA